jgi:hypothetical protein
MSNNQERKKTESQLLHGELQAERKCPTVRLNVIIVHDETRTNIRGTSIEREDK